MALIKHIAIKNVSYSDALAYLKFEHDEFTNKPILDENGEMIRRQFVMLEGINCMPETYGSECTRLNRQYIMVPTIQTTSSKTIVNMV